MDTRSKVSRPLWAGFLLALGACAGEDGGAPAGDPAHLAGRDADTARMINRLAELKLTADPASDTFLNTQRVAWMEGELARAPASGPKRLNLRLELAHERLLAGSAEAAAVELGTVLDELRAKGDRVDPKLRFQVIEQLAVAWLRVGELSNCVEHHGSDSCLAPISAAGRHVDPVGSRKAMELLAELLTARPDNAGARWLYNVAAMTVGAWPHDVPAEWLVPPSAFESDYDIGRFRDVAREAGLDQRGLAGGVCMEDFDGDGRLDLVVSEWSLDGRLRYYRNDGSGRFVERSTEAGFDGITGGLNILHADHDNDGDADILVLRGAWRAESGQRYPISLLANDGQGRFRDVTEAAGLFSLLSTQTAAFADVDGDGWLDLFAGNESLGKHLSPSLFFRNRGDGTFVEMGAAAGLDILGYIKGCAWGDIDNDGRPDLYVSRMDGPKLLFRNLGNLRFEELGKRAGVLGPVQSFPTWWFDYDNDGWLDIFVSGYHLRQTDEVCLDYLGLPNDGYTPKLYRNRGDGTFEDRTRAAGLDHVLPTMGCNLGDLDNDGWLDFYLATGEPDLRGIYPNRLFRNDGAGAFQDVTTSAGMGHLQKGHGIAFGDLDEDGDQDVFAVMGGAYSGDFFQRALFENPGHGNHWIALTLEGRRANRSAIGARIAVRVRRPGGEQRTIHALVNTGGSFGSQTLTAEIGLGDAEGIERIEIRWPGSATQVLGALPYDRGYRVVEGEEPREVPSRPFPLGGG